MEGVLWRTARPLCAAQEAAAGIEGGKSAVVEQCCPNQPNEEPVV